MIHFRHVYKTYEGPVHALRDVDLFIDKGEFVFLTGPSGAGKSTIFRLISAFDTPSSGLIEVCGKQTSGLSHEDLASYRRRIGVIFQDFKLLKDRTLFENIALPLEIIKERPQNIKKKVHDILERVGLTHRRDFYPMQISGGEQQRVAVARALIHQPGVVIADEPTGNLDPERSEEIMDLLEKVNAQGTTVFVATHDHDLVSRRKKRVIKLEQGQLCQGVEARP